MSGAIDDFKEDYDDTLTIPPSQVARENPGVDLSRYSSLKDMIEPVAREKASVLGRKMAADEAAFGRMNSQVAEDRARMTRAYDAMGVEAEKLQPWDQDAAREKFRTDPIASFGSLGSVFAMIASAFTHAPMTNALNASASAMMAIKDGNEAEYEKAFRAFKENNDLTIKRHGMMNTAYQNAATLMDKDISAGKIALLENATRFGDQNLAVMLNNGMDKEAIDYVNSFNKMTKDSAEIGMYMDDVAFRRHALENAKKQNEQIADPRMRQLMNELAYNRITRGKEITPQQLMTESIIAQNPGIGYEKLGELLKQYNLVRGGVGSTAHERALEPYIAKVRSEHPEWSDNAVAIEANRIYTADTTRANYGPNAQRSNAYLEGVKQEHPDWDPAKQQAEADRRMKQSQQVLTENKRVELKREVDNLSNALSLLDKIEKPIVTKLGPVGGPAHVTRLGERVGNLLGATNSTDYVQVSRDITLLKKWASENLLGRRGRPLSDDERKMDTIIAGLSLGDTVQNTLRAHKDLRELYIKLRQQAVTRMGENWMPPPSPAETAKEANENRTRSRQPWLDAPPVKAP